SAVTSRAGMRPGSCAVRRRSSPTASCTKAATTLLRSSRHWRDDAARTAPRRLAADQGHAALVLPDRRQGPARKYAAAQSLVERTTLRRRARPYDQTAAAGRHDVPDRLRLRRPLADRAHARWPHTLSRADRRRLRSRLRPTTAPA